MPVDVLSRWVHIGTAVVVVGGSVFMRFVLMRAAVQLPSDSRDLLGEAVQGIWRKFVHVGIGLLLITGFYNYVRGMPDHEGNGLYHGLMGAKIMIAVAVFLLAAALTSRSKASEPIRKKRKQWLGVTILLATIVIALAGVLKVAI